MISSAEYSEKRRNATWNTKRDVPAVISGETTIISENELDISMLKKEIQEIGYELKDWHSEPYEKKGLFSFGK